MQNFNTTSVSRVTSLCDSEKVRVDPLIYVIALFLMAATLIKPTQCSRSLVVIAEVELLFSALEVCHLPTGATREYGLAALLDPKSLVST